MVASIVLVAAVALALRLCLILGYPPAATPEIAFYRGDAPAYHAFATSLVAGRPYDQGLPFHPPLLAWIAAPIYWLTGGGGATLFLALRAWLAVLGTGLVVLVLVLARRLAGPVVGLWAGTLAAIHFGLAASSTTLNNDGPNALLGLAAIVLVLLARNGDRQPAMGRWHRWRPLALLAGAGVLLGLAALCRAEDQLLVLLVVGWVVGWVEVGGGGAGSWRRRLPGGAAVLAGALVAITPWAVRNAVVIDGFNRARAGVIAAPLDRFAPVSAYGGLNFALANHPEADGGFSRSPLPSPGGNAELNLTNPEHLRYLNDGFAIGLGFIAADPGHWLRLVGRKLAISAEGLRLGYSARDRPAGLRGLRRAVDFMGPERAWLVIPHLLLIVLGIIALRRRVGGAVTLLLHLPALVKLVAVIAFFGYVRLALAAMPVLLIDVALGLAVIGSFIVERWPGHGASEAEDRQPVPWAASAATAGAILLLALALADGGWLAQHGQAIRYLGETELGGQRVNLDGDLQLWPAGEPAPPGVQGLE
jgi:hypothetical protein